MKQSYHRDTAKYLKKVNIKYYIINVKCNLIKICCKYIFDLHKESAPKIIKQKKI